LLILNHYLIGIQLLGRYSLLLHLFVIVAAVAFVVFDVM